jgi:multidrug efflux pump
MRITLDPLKLAFYKITASDIVEVLKRQNLQKGAGRLRENERELLLTMKACLTASPEFEQLPLAERKGGLVRIGDVGKVKVCSEEEKAKIFFNGKPAVLFSLVLESQANPVSVAQDVRNKLQEVKARLPKGMNVTIAVDRSVYIDTSIKQVEGTIWEAAFLVILVVFLFLRSLRASLVPLVTIPISLISTFFMMSIFGFTINVLTLLAMVLAIGLVVDDAIVVLENIYRYIEEGDTPFEASIKGAREISSAIVAMTITLAVVYLPIGLSRGTVGRLFSEFALTLAGSVIISGFVSLTLSPVMCSRLLKGHGSSRGGGVQEDDQRRSPWNDMVSKIGDGLGRFLDRLDFWYGSVLGAVLSRYKALFFGLGVLIFLMGLGIERLGGIPKILAPREDQGVLKTRSLAPLNVSLSYVERHIREVDKILSKVPEVENRLIFAQTAPDSISTSQLVNWKDRKRPCNDCRDSLNEELQDVLGLSSEAYCMSRSPLAGGGEDNLSFVIKTDQSPEELRKVAYKVLRVLRSMPSFEEHSLNHTMDASVPQYSVKVNRTFSSLMGIDPDQISRTLSILIQGVQSTKFEKDNQQYPVTIVVGDAHRRNKDDVLELYMKGFTKDKELFVPLKDLVSIQEDTSLPTISHYDKQRSVEIYGTLKKGESLEAVYRKIESDLYKEVLPSQYSISPSGTLKRYLEESQSIILIFGLAVLFIFLVMAAQFESLIDPFVIMLTVPLALAGAVLTLKFVPDGSINIFSQIGFLTLIGLITKHGILIVDFANEKRRQGKSIFDAVLEASRLRLRPILMTTFAMVLGALPLALSIGAGAESRRQIGWTIVGGMSIGTLFTLFIVPIVYLVLGRFKKEKARDVS